MRTFLLITSILLFATSILTSQEVSTLKKQGACVALPLDSVVHVMGWDMQQVEKSSSGFWGTSVCHLTYLVDQMIVTLNWPSKRSVRNKDLEDQYEERLTRGENGLFYRELENDGDVQVIYGHGHDDYGKHIVLVRKRYGNSAEAMIELKTPAQDHKKLRKRLTRLMALID